MKKFFLLITALIIFSAQAEAAKIEAYQKILESGRYTIRYENLTPAPRVTNKDVMELYGKNGLAVERNDFFLNRPLSGLIVGDGANRYEEVGYKDFFQCRLIKGGENFIFTKYKKGGGFEYFGDKKGKVSANPRNYLVELLSGESFGDANFTEMMTAIISDSKKNSAQKKYKFVTGSKLDNGLTYEDFSAKDGESIGAIRYYFDGNALKKIAFATFDKGKFRNCIVKILEFNSAPEQNFLSLPSGLVDTTKR